ncbi:hypothetical protein TNCV_608271 [Trichonephila clavipes]|nr:hypothetical protein TNCV_608271 [Trichonephila clavipes]
MAEQRYRCIRNAFQVDACRTTKCFTDYIDSCVKMVPSPPVLMEGVDRGLYDTWKKSSFGPCGRSTVHKGCSTSVNQSFGI